MALSLDDLDSIIAKGHECEKGECSVADVEDLVVELQEKQHTLNENIKQVNKMIHSLEVLNGVDDRKVDQVRETVRAIFRVFAMSDKASGNDLPPLTKPTGFSGEIGDGPPDAYKSLNPNPWKASP